MSIISFVSNAISLFNELQADGSLDTIINAVSAVETELTNPKAQALIAQIKTFFSKGK